MAKKKSDKAYLHEKHYKHEKDGFAHHGVHFKAVGVTPVPGGTPVSSVPAATKMANFRRQQFGNAVKSAQFRAANARAQQALIKTALPARTASPVPTATPVHFKKAKKKK